MGDAERRSELPATVRFGLRALVLDPWRESVHRRLMSVYERQGDSTRALRHFHTFRDRLARDLALPPEAATSALFERICRSRRLAPTRIRRRASLAEQERELQRLKGWVAGARARVQALRAAGETSDEAAA